MRKNKIKVLGLFEQKDGKNIYLTTVQNKKQAKEFVTKYFLINHQEHFIMWFNLRNEQIKLDKYNLTKLLETPVVKDALQEYMSLNSKDLMNIYICKMALPYNLIYAYDRIINNAITLDTSFITQLEKNMFIQQNLIKGEK